MRTRHFAQLGPDQAPAALRYCGRRPNHTTFAAGWITDGGLSESPQTPRAWLFADVDQAGEIHGLVYISDTGIVLPMLEDVAALESLVDIGRKNPGAIRVIVGERSIVGELWRRLQRLGFAERIARDQLGYTTTQSELRFEGDLPPLLTAEVANLDELVAASAAMAREEARDDPQKRNPSLFRARIRDRIIRGRDFVLARNGEIVFKCNVSALSDLGGQIEGIYTLPEHRGHGIGRACTASITRWVLERAERAFLLVNDDNTVARRLYETLGYQPVLESRTIFVAP